jgi:DHA2 family multidrug resistance protein-like MFS transporter
MNETSGELGYALGIAILGTIGAAVYRSETGGSVPSGGFVLPEAFTTSVNTVATIAAGLPALVAILMTTSLRSVRAETP